MADPGERPPTNLWGVGGGGGGGGGSRGLAPNKSLVSAPFPPPPPSYQDLDPALLNDRSN